LQGLTVSAEAFESRLRILEEEILRLSKLAAEYVDQSEQDKCWLLAQDLQREARELRAQIRKESQSVAEGHPDPSERDRYPKQSGLFAGCPPFAKGGRKGRATLSRFPD
jgi:hypothetical protein